MDITQTSDSSLESSCNESYLNANLNDAYVSLAMEDDNSHIDENRELESASDTKYDLSDSTSYHQFPDSNKPSSMVDVGKDSIKLCEQQISNSTIGLYHLDKEDNQHTSSSQERPTETKLSKLLKNMLDATIRNPNFSKTSTKTPVVSTNIDLPGVGKHGTFLSEENQTKFSLSPKYKTCIKPVPNRLSDISHSKIECSTILEHSNEAMHNLSQNPYSNWSRMFLATLRDKKLYEYGRTQGTKPNESQTYTEEDYSMDLNTASDMEATHQESCLHLDQSFNSSISLNDAFLSASEVSFENRVGNTDLNETYSDRTTTNDNITENSLKDNSPANLPISHQLCRIRFTDINKKSKAKKRRSRSLSDDDEFLNRAKSGKTTLSKISTQRSSDDCVIEESTKTVKELIRKFSDMHMDQYSRMPQPTCTTRRRQRPMVFVTPASPF